MAQVIIYPSDADGTGSEISVIHPAVNTTIPINEIARKDVPAGVPYLIIEDTDLPANRDFREAWTADFSTPDGTGIGPDAWFAEQEA